MVASRSPHPPNKFGKIVEMPYKVEIPITAATIAQSITF
jgi:hypothetical protein